MSKSVWYRAAEMVVKTNSFACCGCILRATDVKYRKKNIKLNFYEFFKPWNLSENTLWWGEITEENKLPRSLALLLMHELEKDGQI